MTWLYNPGKQKQRLAHLIRKEYFKSIAYPLIVIELTLLIAYFWSNHFVNEASREALTEETRVNMSELSRNTANLINKEFEEVALATHLLQARHGDFFRDFASSEPLPVPSSYFTTSDGVISNTQTSSDECTLFYSSRSGNNPDRMRKAVASAELDPFYNQVLSTNENIVQVYFNSHDSMNRLCPFMEDALNQYPHDINIPEYNFYYLADLKHNPEKKVVWTEAYLDPAGKGWMISAIAPVYHREMLEGVVGIDITLEKIIDNILNIRFPYTTYAMLVDGKGNIIAMNRGLEPILGIREVTTHTYSKPVSETIDKPEDFNLLKESNNSVVKNLRDIYLNHIRIGSIRAESYDYMVTQNSIAQTQWQLILLVDKHSMLSNINRLKSKTDNVGYLILAFMVIFYVLFVLLIVYKSRTFAQTILDPIRTLITATEDLKLKLEILKIKHSGIREFDTLIDNFSMMGEELTTLYQTMQSKIEEGISKYTESQDVLIYQSRLAAMGEMINMIAHQWRQPLSIISMTSGNIYLDMQMGTGNQDSIKSGLDEIMRQTEALSKTIDGFRNYFKPEESTIQISLSKIFQELDSVIGKSFDLSGIDLEYPIHTDIELITYPRELIQVFMNILKNSVDAFEMRDQTEKWVHIRVEDLKEWIVFEFRDNAGGIPNEVMERIFEPYFTTKNEKNGTGLGLYIAKIIIRKHMGGSIEAFNESSGACFRISLPKHLSMNQREKENVI